MPRDDVSEYVAYLTLKLVFNGGALMNLHCDADGSLHRSIFLADRRGGSELEQNWIACRVVAPVNSSPLKALEGRELGYIEIKKDAQPQPASPDNGYLPGDQAIVVTLFVDDSTMDRVWNVVLSTGPTIDQTEIEVVGISKTSKPREPDRLSVLGFAPLRPSITLDDLDLSSALSLPLCEMRMHQRTRSITVERLAHRGS